MTTMTKTTSIDDSDVEGRIMKWRKQGKERGGEGEVEEGEGEREGEG